MNSQQKIGIALLAVPIPLLAITLACYAIFSFVIATMTDASTSVLLLTNIVNVILSALGIVALIGIPIGMPIGAILLVMGAKKK